MKKSFKWVLIFVLVIVSYLPICVSAQDISQADFDSAKAGTPSNGVSIPTVPMTGPASYLLEPGEYKFVEDINLDDHIIALYSGSYVFDLNGKTILFDNEFPGIHSYDSEIVIKGNGIIKSVDAMLDPEILDFSNSIVTIENGEFQGTIRVETIDSGNSDKESLLTINSGKIGTLYVNDSEAIINDGEIDSFILEYYYPAITVGDNSKITINGGTFSGNSGIVSQSDSASIIINGGSFEGGSLGYGVSINKETKLNISKGTFSGGKAGIMIFDAEDDDFANILSKDSKYSPELVISRIEFSENSYALATQKEISVVKNVVVKEDTEPKFLDGENQELNIGKDSTITFRINVKYDVFSNGGQVYVDDKLVDSSYYSLGEGSTIITLQNEFVKNLSVGEHTFMAKVNNTELSTKFNVLKNDNLNPQTGDEIFISLIAIMVCVTGIMTFLALKGKKEGK